MNCSNFKFEEVLIDGQAVVVPIAEKWEEIIHTPVFLGAPAYLGHTKKLAIGLITFALKHKEKFRLGLFRAKGMKSWTILPLILLDGRFQRVHVEYVMCSKCGWRLTIANPSEPSLYFGVPNELDATKNALKLPRVTCPNCCTSLPRVAVWVESSDSGVDGN